MLQRRLIYAAVSTCRCIMWHQQIRGSEVEIQVFLEIKHWDEPYTLHILAHGKLKQRLILILLHSEVFVGHEFCSFSAVCSQRVRKVNNMSQQYMSCVHCEEDKRPFSFSWKGLMTESVRSDTRTGLCSEAVRRTLCVSPQNTLSKLSATVGSNCG